MIKQFTFNHFEVNTYVIFDEQTKLCAIVDPACEASFEDSQLMQFVEVEGLTPVMVLLTHAHVDHIAGLRQVCEHYHLPVTMHAEGRHLLKQAALYGDLMGFAVDDMSDLEVHGVKCYPLPTIHYPLKSSAAMSPDIALGACAMWCRPTRLSSPVTPSSISALAVPTSPVATTPR